MAMVRSLQSVVSGLKGFQTELDVTGINRTDFKGKVTYLSLFFGALAMKTKMTIGQNLNKQVIIPFI
ncbi:hypothetical protein [Sporolactobacillus sp. KGMB 08714]|uniref:hypothetical protein n=1 Tax=Sporolactobacillus sp. KGMB 08714 TaxID=3064704 RepID=UPI002FBF1DBD